MSTRAAIQTERTDLAQTAHAYHASGLCVLPAKNKRVTLTSWKEFQHEPPHQDSLDDWFDEETGARALCLVCGSVSGNLEAIDFDLGGQAFEPWRTAVHATNPGLLDRVVIQSTPSGGCHVLYRCDEPVAGNMKLAVHRVETGGPGEVVIHSKPYVPRRLDTGEYVADVAMIETRGEGGIIMAAPSDGYDIVQGDVAQIPTISADERDALIVAARMLNEVHKPVVTGPQRSISQNGSSQRPGDDFTQRGDIRPVLVKHGWTCLRPGENEHWTRPGKDGGTSATLKDGVLYVFTTNAPPFEGDTPYSIFAAYTMLEHHGDFSAAASALGRSGYGDKALPFPPAEYSSEHPDMKPNGQVPSDVAVPETEPVPVVELVHNYPKLRDPIIQGLLRVGETMNVIAAPKTGKSWLTIDLAIAIATGRPWLDRYDTEPGDVLIIDNELHQETAAHRIPMVARARGVPMSEYGTHVYVDNLRGRLMDFHRLRMYFRKFKRGRFKVVILDAFYRFMPMGCDENDNGNMANIYNMIDAIADEHGCSFILIHHSTKGNQSGKSVTDVGAGAGAQSRATDSHLVLRPHEEAGVVVLDAAVRSWKPIEPTCLRWEFPTWAVDDTLDPSLLRNEGKASPRRKASECAELEKPPEWTLDSFIDAFITDTPKSKSALELEGLAHENNLSMRAAGRFLTSGVEGGQIATARESRSSNTMVFMLPKHAAPEDSE